MKRIFALGFILVVLARPGLAQNPTGETATPVRPRFATLAPVFFSFNSVEITDSARATLSAAAEILAANPEAAITLTGHTDERGTEAYNHRLGQRRASAVASFLAARGVPASRLNTTSAGESEPLERGHEEAAWARNRRVEFHLKGDAPLRLPRR